MKRILHGLTAPFLLAVFLFVLPSTNVSAQIGCMSVGSFDQSGGGTLTIEVQTTTPCTGHDQLQVAGTATLGGVLEIVDFMGFVAPTTASGNDYVVLTAGAIVSDFASTNFPSIPGANPSVDLVWSYSIVGNTVVVNVVDPCNPDVTPPTIACPANTTIFTNPANQCTSPFNIQALASSSDNCGTPSINTISVNALPGYMVGSPVVMPAGVNAVEYLVTDGAGNTATCTYNVTVQDNDPPILNCPPNITVQSSGGDDNIAGDCGATVQWSAFTVSDNCPGVNVTQIGGPAIGTFVSVGLSTITYRATDLAGNTSTCSFTVTVVDDEAPTITCPTGSPFSRFTDDPLCAYTTGGTEFDPTAMDNCPLTVVVSNDFNGMATLAGANIPQGSTTIIWTVTSGLLSATCSITIDVADDDPPTFTCPGPQTAFTNGSVNCEANVPNLAALVTDEADNCGTAIVTQSTATGTAITVTDGQIINYTITVTDGAGNTATCTVAVTYEDDDAPTFTCPGAQTAYTNGNVNCEANVPDLVVLVTDEADNCGTAIVTQSTASGTAITVTDGQIINYTVTVTDGAGNTATCTVAVTYEDDDVPTFTCPGAQTAFTNGNVNCEANVPNLAALVADEADNCGTAIVTQSTAAGTPITVTDGQIINYTVTVTDGAGNTATCTVAVTYEDDDAPTFTCPGPQTAFTNGNVNCEANVPNLAALVADEADNCGIAIVTQSTAAGTAITVTDGQLINYTITVTDGAGNTATCTVAVTYEDDDAPTFTCPGAQTVYTNGNVNCEANVPDLVVLVTDEADNCGTAIVTQSTASGTAITVTDGQIINYTLTVTDGAGNTATCTVAVTYEDDDVPTFTCPGAQTAFTNGNVNCEANVPNLAALVTDEADNCGTAIVTQSTAAGTAITVTDGQVINYTVTVTDGAGNTATCTVAVTYEDDDAPTFTCPGAQTAYTNGNINCEANVPDLVVLVTDEADNCGTAIVTQSSAAGTAITVTDGQIINYTVTVTDGAGNTATCTVAVTYEDDDNPVAVCPSYNVTITLGSPSGTYTLSQPEIDALGTGSTDNCVIASYSINDDFFDCADSGFGAMGDNIVTRVLTVTDGAGNTNTCSVSFEILPLDPLADNVIEADVCSDVSFTLNFQDYIDNGVPSNFSWTVNYGAATGGAYVGTQTLSTITETLTNITPNVVNVVYTITAFNSATNCQGSTFTVTVPINPEPQVANQTVTVCSDVALGLTLGNDPNGPAVVAYNINSITTTLTASAGNPLAPANNVLASEIADDAWTNKGNAITTVVYNVTPISADGCEGNPFTVTASIRPEPVVNSFAAAAACSDVNVGGSSTLPTNPTNTPVAIATYRWASLSVPGSITVNGAADPLATPLGTVNSSTIGNYPFNISNTGIFAGINRAIINNDNFNNVTSLHDTVRYRIIPITSAATGSCAGDTFQVKVPVYPEPVGAGSTETACSGVTFSYDLNENLTNLGAYPDPLDDDLEPVTFNWQITSMSPAPFAVGAAVGDTGSGATLTDNVTNIFNFPLTVNYTVTPTSTFGCAGTPFVVSVVVNNKPLVSLNPNGDNTLCQGEERTLLGNATNLPPSTFTYEWSIVSASPGNASLANANTQNAVLTAQTDNTNTLTIKLKVINAEGCADSTTYTFTVNPVPSFAAGEPADLAACATVANGQQGIFNLANSVPTTSGTISYHVSASDAEAGIGAIPNAGSYTGNNGQEIWVRLTGVNGCYTIESIILTVNPLPTASISGDDELCAGESTTLTASGGSSYSWSNMAMTPGITVSPAVTTTYTVTVSDANGCTDTESVEVIVNPLPTAAISPASATICNGESVDLTATGGASYLWSNGAVTPSITVSPVVMTTYTVTVTDVNGCTDTEVATINVNPNPTFAGGEPLALNTCESVQGGAVGIFNLNNAVPTTSGTISFHVSQSDATAGTGDIPSPGSYTGVDNQVIWVRVEDMNGCFAVSSFVLNTWTLPTASISGDLEICVGQNTTLTASGGATYSWSTMAVTPGITVSPVATTSYTVVVTDGNGCTNSASATVVVNPLPVVTISATDTLVCGGDAVTLTASGGGTYAWSNGANTAAITVNVTATTTYSVVVTDANGCSNSASKTIYVSPAMAWSSATAQDVSCNGGSDGSVSANVTGGTPMVTLSWEDGDGNPVGTSGLSAGTYHVTATDGAGCTIDTLLVVGEPTAIQIQGLIVTNVSCNGDSTGTAFATITGGTPAIAGYNVTLTGSSLTLTQTDFGFFFDELPADTYTVEVEDENGCTATTQFTVTEPTALQVSATSDDADCNGGNGTITGNASGGTPGYTYFIDFPNDGQPSPVFNAPAGTYMLVVEDSQSCRDSVAVTVGEPALLTATASSTNESCTGAEDGTATVVPVGGTPGYTYSWSNGQTTAIATGLAAGAYTVTVTDNNGCTTTASATVAVTGPGAAQVVNCPTDTTLYVLECDISFAWVAPTINDNCNVIELDVDLGGAVNEGYAAGVQQANFAIGTYTVTYTNPGPDTVACTFDVTVIDTIAPVILCPPTERVACIEDVSDPLVGFVDFINAGGVLNDNCTVDLSSIIHVSTLSTGTPECVNKDTLIRTYSVVDIYNNANTCEQLIIVKDSIAPTFVTFAADTIINCDADSTALALGAPTGDDNCNAAVTYSHSNTSTQGSNPADCDYYNYVVTRTWVITDACGNTATDNQVISVQDTTAPDPVCVDISVNLLPSGMVSIVAADINGASDDNCMPSGLLNLSATPTTFTCAEVGANNVVLTVTDACGNSATCVAVVTVVDTEPPVAICNAAIDVYLDVAGEATIDTTDINNGSWDNCAIDTMTLSVYNFDCGDVAAPVTVQMVVFDVYGNSDTCYTVVTVLDTIAPVAVCTTTTLYLDATGNATVDAEDLDGGSTDACGGLTFSANPDDFTCSNVGPNSSILTVTDVNGNSSTCLGTVIVVDTIDPVAVCQNINLYLDATGNATVDADDLDGGSTDACGGLTFSAAPASFTCANVGPNTVVLTVTDVNNNSATCLAIVTVIDTIDPVAVCQDTTLYLDVTGNVTITAPELDGGSTDACGGLTFAASQTAFDCSDVATSPNAVVVTVTDVNGNSSTCTALVTVLDTVPPIAECQDITVQLDAMGNGGITGVQLNDGSTDACGGLTFAANPNTFDCGDVGANTVVLTVTDVNGNTATCTSIVTVEDNVPPVALCQDVTVSLDANGEGSTTASAVNNGSNDACGIDTMYLNIYDFTCANVGPNTVVLTVVDVNGNSSTCSATANVVDLVAPIAICSDTTIYLNGSGLASVTAPQLDGGSSDACGIQSFAAAPTSFDCSDLGPNSVILTVTDVNGNSATCVSIVTVLDTLAPVFSQCPGNAVLNSDPNGCYQNYQIVLDTIFDNCTAANLINVQLKGRVVANNGVIPMTISPLGAGGYTITATFGMPVGNNRVTVIATDAQGNVDSCEWFVQVNDIWAPIISNCPVDVTVNVNPTACTAQAFWPVPIPSDNCSGVMMTTQNNNQYFPGYFFPWGTTNVVYTATDASGNTTSCSFNVNVVGTCTPPAPDLSPEHTTGSTSYAPGQTKNVVVRIRNLSANPTTAPVTFYVQKMDPNFTVFVDPNATSVTVGVNTFSVMNSDWVITEQATRWRFVSKPGVVINGNTTNFVAVQLTATGNQGSTAGMTTTIVSGTGGGETPTTNNIKITGLSIN